MYREYSATPFLALKSFMTFKNQFLCITCLFAGSDNNASGDRSHNEVRELTKKIMINLPHLTHSCFRKYHDERTLNTLLQLTSCLNPASMPIFRFVLLHYFVIEFVYGL